MFQKGLYAIFVQWNLISKDLGKFCSSYHDLLNLLIFPLYINSIFLFLQILVKRGADLFAENENKETPCDCAERQHHKELALSLESQMVFSTDPHAEDIEAEYAALDRREVSSPNKLWIFLWH